MLTFVQSAYSSQPIGLSGDDSRNEAYEKAIESNLRRRRGLRCVDVGTGSGLLALLCNKHGAGDCS